MENMMIENLVLRKRYRTLLQARLFTEESNQDGLFITEYLPYCVLRKRI